MFDSNIVNDRNFYSLPFLITIYSDMYWFLSARIPHLEHTRDFVKAKNKIKFLVFFLFGFLKIRIYMNHAKFILKNNGILSFVLRIGFIV